MKIFFLLVSTAMGALCAPPPPQPPGTVIHHAPASSGQYIGSPSLCVAPDGAYLASHDFFGPASREFERASGRLYRSSDKGVTWSHVHDFDGFFWTGLFVHGKDVFLMGTDKHHGNMIIRRSSNSGRNWSGPSVLAVGEWHTAPMPVIASGDRVWRAVEDAHSSNKWGERYRARMMSAPQDADLMKSESWTISNALARNPDWLGGGFRAWLEGNAVVGPDGELLDILRVDTPNLPEKAALVRISADGSTARFDPNKDIVDFPGGAKKFTIRKDPTEPGYWALSSIVPDDSSYAGPPSSIRNTLALLFSPDLRKWEVRCLLLRHPDPWKHGFQYVDWLFDGPDLIAVCRTAWEDREGGARNNHDANFLTFHRWKDFRKLNRDKDASMPEIPSQIHETSSFVIKGSSYEIARLRTGETAFSNRAYRWREVPEDLSSFSFIRADGGGKQSFEVSAKNDTLVTIATAAGQEGIDLKGWKDEGTDFSYDDPQRTRVRLFSRPLKRGETLRLPVGNWTGAILILKK